MAEGRSGVARPSDLIIRGWGELRDGRPVVKHLRSAALKTLGSPGIGLGGDLRPAARHPISLGFPRVA